MSIQATDQLRSSGRSEGVGALKVVSAQEAFYFYRGFGQSLDISSRSLSEFVGIVQGIDPSSVQFHVENGDFERWFRFLGEQSLANRVHGLRGKNISAEELRTEVSLAVGSRVHEQQWQSQGGGRSQGAGSGGRSGTSSSGRSSAQ